jgi:hypothetical protein
MALQDDAPTTTRRKPRRPRQQGLALALRRALALGRPPSILEQAEIDRTARAMLLAERLFTDPHADDDVKLRAERTAERLQRKLLGNARPKPSGPTLKDYLASIGNVERGPAG